MAYYTLLSFFFAVSIFPDGVLSDFVVSNGVVSEIKMTLYFPPNVTTSWKNNNDSIPITPFDDGSFVRFLLLSGGRSNNTSTSALGYGCGFFCCPQWRGMCQFVIIFVETNSTSVLTRTKPHVVWSANRDNMVRENATLEFSEGNLVVRDDMRVIVWSSKTSSAGVVGMSISKAPNLELFNIFNATVWESFDHPTDAIAIGQLMRTSTTLTSSPQSYNSSSGFFSLSITNNGLTAFVNFDVWSIPYLVLGDFTNSSFPVDALEFVSLDNRGLMFGFKVSGRPFYAILEETMWLPPSKFLRLDPDGTLRIYSWMENRGWAIVYDFMARRDPCQVPLRCGRYSVCNRGQCSCPMALGGDEYFTPVDTQAPQLGCIQSGLLTAGDEYKLVDFGGLRYFAYSDAQAAVQGIQKLDDCRNACLMKDSCRAVFFAYSNNDSDGRCYLPSEVLTMQATDKSARLSSSYLKVRVFPNPSSSSHLPSSRTQATKAMHDNRVMLAVVVVASFIFVSVVVFVMVLWRKRVSNCKEELIEYLSGMPARFSYKDLCSATAEFSQKIGKGGFGTVFRGVLNDGTLVAVKRLDNSGQGMDEFLAEVKTIGSIHHINLVRLIGFCAEKTHRLLVYEYMSNGSLDKWIFGSKKQDLGWKTKIKIITDIAKGLAYLHEECRQRIAHLDVKPHNILLDDKLNAKISDFGLARFIDRERSQVTTTLRGTLGYLAPEWQVSEHITVKADIYSFGIVLLEILCGRKNLDYEQHDSRIRLLSLLRRKADEGQLIDVVYKQVEEINVHGEEEEALRLIRIGLWCLNDDYKKRPSMSTVVKVLEGATEFEDSNISYHFAQTMVPAANEAAVSPPQT